MNFVGKILTVLICVMSLVFMTIAMMVYATHTNWRDVVMRPEPKAGQPKGLWHQLEEKDAELKNLHRQFKNAKDELERERITKQDQLSKLETAINEYRNQQTRLENQVQKLKTSEGKAVAAMNQTQETLKKLRGEITTLREQNRRAQQERDDSFEKSVALADQVHQREVEIKRLESAARSLGIDVARMRDLLRAFDINPDQDPARVLPRVSGRVLAVVGKGSVELSIGGDDGLKKGHQLQVFRIGGGQKRYLGRIEVMDTAPDRAVCTIIPKYRTGAIRVGDSVTSKFD